VSDKNPAGGGFARQVRKWWIERDHAPFDAATKRFEAIENGLDVAERKGIRTPDMDDAARQTIVDSIQELSPKRRRQPPGDEPRCPQPPRLAPGQRPELPSGDG
jgi:hypothetical protein